MAAPSVKLDDLLHVSTSIRKQAAATLLDSLKSFGYVKLTEHGISDDEVKDLFNLSRSFFSLPTAIKQSVAHEKGPKPQRGWSRVGSENSAALYRSAFSKNELKHGLSDAREHWDQGASNDAEYPNMWPADDVLPGFRKQMETMYDRLSSISDQLLFALELALDLPRGSFTSKVTHRASASEFRFNHYPAIGVEALRQGTVGRIWPHFDLGVITLLFQDAVGGLEFENRRQPGNFERVPCGKPSEIIVNISETLQRWTNDVLPAGLHRVVAPLAYDHVATGVIPDRYSIAFFTKADRHASVAPLTEFVTDTIPSKYQEITAVEYHQQRLRSAY